MSALIVAAIALLVLVLGGVVRAPGLVAVGLAGGVFAYAIGLHLLHGSARPLSAVLVAAALLVAGEVGFGLVRRAGAHAPRAPRLPGGGAAHLAACAVVVLGVGSLPLGGSAAATVIGTVAAVLAVGLLVAAVRGEVGED